MADRGGVNQELGQEEIVRAGDSTRLQILLELLDGELQAELVVEGSAVGDESASFCHITHQLSLRSHKLLTVLNPANLVIGEGRNEAIGLVHLLSRLGGLVSQLLLLGNFCVEFGLQGCLQLVDSVQLFLGCLQLGTRLLQRNGLLVEQNELGLHNLGLLVIVAHSRGPSAKTPKRGRGSLGDLRVKQLFALF